MAATSGHIEGWNRSWTRLSARFPAGPMSRSSRPPVSRPATGQCPGPTTLLRSDFAQIHGDAEATAAFAAQVLAEVEPGEQMISATAHGFLAVAEWLRGRLTEAERAFTSSVTGWREARQPTQVAWGYY